jgi:hypothetical protein
MWEKNKNGVNGLENLIMLCFVAFVVRESATDTHLTQQNFLKHAAFYNQVSKTHRKIDFD